MILQDLSRVLSLYGQTAAFVRLKLMFDSDTMGVAFGLGLPEDLEMGG